MDPTRLIDSLERTAAALSALVSSLDTSDATWKPSPDAWSIVEIAGHLLHEERHDFRLRLKSTLEDPGAPWPSLDPEAAVQEEAYGKRDLSDVWSGFVAERRASLGWLRALGEDTDWTAAHPHTGLGTLSAGDLLTSWAAHDVLHLRQIAARLHQRIAAAGEPHDARYAGPLT